MEQIKRDILEGKTFLGIELGSTRIKAVLISEDGETLAGGSHDWENVYQNGMWTYELADVWAGLSGSYQALAADVKTRYGVRLKRTKAIGISAMMHGYLAFDKDGRLLVEFRTWRNTMTSQAAGELTKAFSFNIPQRWSIAHLYQAILNKEEHVRELCYLTTLSGYVHWKLTGEKVLGIGDASGMFPIDSSAGDFHQRMLDQTDALVADRKFPWRIRDILPRVLKAGTTAGTLTKEGAELLDPSGELEDGIMMCPPEGDAGTGMTATNSVRKRTGNVSAGTSVFAMLVLERELSGVYPEIDMVTTPDGAPVAMVHCNNCTSDLNEWMGLFEEVLKSFGTKVEKDNLFSVLYQKALEGSTDCGGLLAYNFVSGEHIPGFEEGRPLFVRQPGARLGLGDFMRTHLYTSMGALSMGLSILRAGEQVIIDKMYGHGGLFKTRGVGQRFMAAAMEAPVTVMETAGEGGAWGIALLAAYVAKKDAGESLSDYLEHRIFKARQGETEEPRESDVAGFKSFMERYRAGLPIERAAVDMLAN